MAQPNAEKRTSRIVARCLPSEKSRIEQEAAALGYEVTAYLLHCALHGKKPKPKPRATLRTMDRAAFDRLHELGEVLNGQARAMNRGRDYTPQAVLDSVAAIGRIVNTDPATRVLFATSPGDIDHPLHPADWKELVKIGGNLTQIAGHVTPGLFRDAAPVIRAFADKWAKALAAEEGVRKGAG